MGNGIINRYKTNYKSGTSVTRTSKVVITYDKWVQSDSKKWGHYKEFDINYYLTNSTCQNNNNQQSQSNNSNNLISINGITNNGDGNFNNYSSGGDLMLFQSNSSNNNNNNSNTSKSFSSASSTSTIVYYVNGRFFKPLERLGDSQFIISEFNQNDIIVTLPSNIERYRTNERITKEMSSRLNRVIGVCDQYLVFQIWKGNSEVEIFIYDYTKCTPQSVSSRIVRKLNRRFNSRTYTCLISPDKNVLLITPDYEDNHSYSQQSHSEITLIMNINTFAVLRVTAVRCDQRFAFDPRFAYSRLAEFDTVRGQITDLNSEKVIVCSNHTLKTKVFRVEYTKDGYLIIVICTLPIFQRVKRNYFIYVLNSSTLLHMRSIIDYRGPLLSTYTFTNEFYLLFNMYPSLSNCATNIAVLKNIEPSSNIRVIELYSLPTFSITLKEICRKVILRLVDSKNIHKLPLPDKLISYLAFNVR